MKKAGHLLAPLLLGTLALLGSQAPANAAQFCVNTPASLQTALTTAASNGVDDEVRIVQGTYVGNFFYASTEAQALAVLGGYTAGCAGRLLDPVNTVLDGNQTNRVLALLAPDVAADFLVEGLTLRNGKPTSGEGGGLLAKVGTDGAVTVNHDRIENNTASNGSGGGASISSATPATLTLTNNSITGNTANGDGGGFYYNNTAYSYSTATLTNNSITGNTASHNGGGAYIHAFATATLTNNNISSNTASYYGGGAYIIATATLTNNNISSNTAAKSSVGSGGGVYIISSTATLTNNSISGNMVSSGRGGGANIDATTTTLTNNSISGNLASGEGGGANIFSEDGTVTLTSNDITSNTSGSAGGGAYIGGARTTRLTNNSITGNTASYGGGAFIYCSSFSFIADTATLTNNTFVGNEGADGGGLWLRIGVEETLDWAALYNNLFLDNRATGTGATADLRLDNDYNGDYLPTPVTLLANNFDQSAAGFKSTLPITLDPSNLDAEDPLFVDQAVGNLRLTAGSPMIDAGYPDTPDLPATDIAGGLRVVKGIVDIGAYEYHEYESCELGPLVFSAETFDAGGDHHLSEVSIATEGSVEILSEADVVLRAPFLNFGPGFRIETGAQFMALAGPVSCNQ